MLLYLGNTKNIYIFSHIVVVAAIIKLNLYIRENIFIFFVF